jgi:hypothetical protein
MRLLKNDMVMNQIFITAEETEETFNFCDFDLTCAIRQKERAVT